jgi:hypothetical protein
MDWQELNGRSYVAFVSRGAAVALCRSLKMLVNSCNMRDMKIAPEEGADLADCPLFSKWCGRRDSNPHDFRHGNLNPARLPVPPRPRPEGGQEARLISCSLRGTLQK